MAEGNPGELLSFRPATYEHSSGLFKVNFTPDFGVRLDRAATAVHIWNTAHPSLNARTVYSALSLLPETYEGLDMPEDFAVLCLRERKIYRLSEAGRYADLGEGMAERVAEGIRKAIEDLQPDNISDQPRV